MILSAHPLGRRSSRWIGAVATAVLLAACTSGAADDGPSGTPEAPVPAVALAQPSGPLVLAGRSGEDLALAASRSVFQSSPVAVTVAIEGPVDQAAEQARTLGVPLLVAGAPEDPTAAGSPAAGEATASGSTASGASGSTEQDADPLATELARLGASHVLHVGPGRPAVDGVAVVTDPADLPEHSRADDLSDVVALTAPKAAGKANAGPALASLRAAGAEVLELADADPRATEEDVRALAGADPAGVVGVGRRFGSPEVFTGRIETAVTGVQLPGGGQTIFDGKRYVALYGHPITNVLGVLGEQGPAASVTRAQRLAKQYEPHAKQTIVPAFEIIATVASGDAGKDGNYSNEWDIDVLRPLVDEAAEKGVYVILDLQSGRDDFVTQAKLYEELLLEPHVGLALDPEWRLKAKQLPNRQIGSTSAEEINDTTEWLAELTAANDLPQKMVLLHQFRLDMIPDRADVDLSHDELALIVQMDGDGNRGQKLDTWRALLTDAPKGLRFGWKNFYDEDEPTLSPAQTFNVRPKPWWVSYQ